MTILKTIPIIRIFDYQKVIEFYVDWLGFTIVWEHHFEDNTPVYMEVEKDGLTLHLSEHHGDATPGAKVFIWCTGLKEFHEQLKCTIPLETGFLLMKSEQKRSNN